MILAYSPECMHGHPLQHEISLPELFDGVLLTLTDHPDSSQGSITAYCAEVFFLLVFVFLLSRSPFLPFTRCARHRLWVVATLTVCVCVCVCCTYFFLRSLGEDGPSRGGAVDSWARCMRRWRSGGIVYCVLPRALGSVRQALHASTAGASP